MCHYTLYKYEKQLKNEVGMAGSKSTQTRDNHTIHPYACFLRGTKITSNNVIESKLINLNHYDN